MSDLSTTKSVLAKLMAAENINVVHQKLNTAYFDLKSRTLMCPIWQDMDGDLYDLLMGHEVGHALETPLQGWHDAVSDDTKKGFKSYLNVIEDARIEKKIKRRYPGLSRSFSNAYAELYQRDFFGIKKLDDLNKLSLIDRINVWFKIGSHVMVSFSDEERVFVHEIENAETWEQVEDIANRVYEYTKANEKDKIKSLTDLEIETTEGVEPEDGDAEDSGDDGESFDMEGGDPDDLEGSEFEESEESKETKSKTPSGSDDSKPEDKDDPQSVTDRSFRNKERELINDSGMVSVLELPDADLSKIVQTNDVVLHHFERGIIQALSLSQYARIINYEMLATKCTIKFNKNNKRFISHILTEFEMRKKATQYARTQTARTGELDMGSLHKYKYTNDIFKKISVVGKGKNHGMILFLDMSGSMQSIFRNTVEQLLVLTSFCKVANIPFDVYGFSDSALKGMTLSDKFPVHTQNCIGIHSNSFHLKHLIGSSLPKAQYRRAFDMLAIIANEYGRTRSYYGMEAEDNDHCNFDYHDWADAGFSLNSTPFIETLLASRELISKFKTKHKNDIVNVIYMTDGEGSGGIDYPKHIGYDERRGVIYLVDKKTKKKVKCTDIYNMQPNITKLVRDVTGAKHIGFYLADARTLSARLKWDSNLDGMKRFEAKNSLSKDNFYASKSIGYDNYFFMKTSTANIKEEEMTFDSTATKSVMLKQFKNSMNSKRSNRVLVSKFTEEISF